MRTLTGPAGAVLGGTWALAQLVDLDLASGNIRVTTAGVDIDWNGDTYIGRKMIGVEAVKDQGGEVQGLTFTLSGVPIEFLSLALQEQVQGRPVRIWTAILDGGTHAILDVVQTWAGTCDRMPIQQSANTATISVTAEHRGITFSRAKGLRYTDGDPRLYAGDKSLEFIVSQSSHQDVWPAASFFKK
jgi:hypothetical protein